MRHFRYALLPVLLAGVYTVSAQDVQEALDLSNTSVQGTARSMGFGNALGSVGGDYSSVGVNPAGLGVYRTSELALTPSLKINGASSKYMGTTTTDNNTRFNINNFGIVLTNAPKGIRYDRRAWKTFSFAFGMNRIADFNHNYSYGGKNTGSSGSQVFESDANQYPNDVQWSGPYNGLGYTGYWAYLLNQNTQGQYYSIVPFAGGVDQYKSIQVTGGIKEYAISFAGNYKEKLMLGITFGIPSVKYERSSYYKETISSDNNSINTYNFTSFTYNQNLKISGGGINAKIGAIYKINDQFRVGAAFHSPTFYSITDVYTPSIRTIGNDTDVTLIAGDNYDNHYLQENQFDYNFTTPWKAVASATYLFKKVAFVTVDYEYVAYNSMRYRLPADASGNSTKEIQDALNSGIRNAYKSTSNLRIGAEGRLGKFFMLRAGFGYYGNPYKGGNDNAQRMDICGGLGFRFTHFFVDLGLVHSMYQLQEQAYNVDYTAYNGAPSVISGLPPAMLPTATTNFSVNNFALTVGVKF